MSSGTTVPVDRALSPDDWPHPAERDYADAQARLADHYDVAAESRVTETDAVGRVHYLVGGDPDSDPVVLLHGVGTPAATWLPLFPALTHEYRVYAPDRPGLGLSAAPSYRNRDLRSFLVAYLLDLLDDLAVERPHVVGNSHGGLQSFLLAIDHDRVDRLQLVGAPGGVSRDLPLLFRLLTVRGLNRVLLWLLNRGDPVENARQSMQRVNVVEASAIPEVFYELLAAGQGLPGRGESQRSLATAQGSYGRAHPLFDIRNEITQIHRPTQFVWGTDDAFWSPGVGRPVAETMPDAQFHELPGHGHTPWLEPDDAAAELVREFLD
ncbi:Pimeloyl-ACP methyl ester carboxylesterase [Haloarcula vallismortis]|uniref:2-hydroxy-6-ketonona-2,4-dienedioic acid hydrolase n=2 Tax=Haloarcula vallismortis TaxID=28442 RepID=M0JU84_HALVA|nr:alpha/beta hydrolase [Haloarcula vallismortis]EMA11509.1 2-hydroxy-6-ketonona-2,4-dienedioic acid hydrolase [Haloarcula vallismortis ATCC 29715]SDW43306.1 Pimeloyl-ACP methyl ester carboxylesterase [Haloarcula vallismortis]